MSSRIKHNAGTSPLLKLPLEVQTNIFTKLLGDREIKVKTPEKGQDIVRGTEPQGFMNALATCRQIYIVAAPIFWSTNTFSFEDPKAYTSWMKNRTAHQKRSLRSIQLRVDLLDVPFHVAPQDIKLLTGLRNLSLTICRFDDGGSVFEQYKERFNSIDMMFDIELKGVESFAMLPLKNVEVSIAATTLERPPPQYAHYWKRAWNQDEEKEFADMVKRMLLDPDPAGTKACFKAQLAAEWEVVKEKYRKQ